jgi:hemin uptake protein HemP
LEATPKVRERERERGERELSNVAALPGDHWVQIQHQQQLEWHQLFKGRKEYIIKHIEFVRQNGRQNTW